MSTSPSTATTSQRLRRSFGALVAGGMLAATLGGVLAGPVAAKEVTSGGGAGGTTTTCSPVSNLIYKGDATTSDTSAATVQVDYGVKPCDKNAVRVEVLMWRTADATDVVWSDTNAPQSGRFTVGVRANTSYQVKVSVFNAATNALVGSRTIYAAAVYKGV